MLGLWTRLRTSHLGLWCMTSVESVLQVGPLLSCANHCYLSYEPVWLGPEEQGREKEPVWQQLSPLDFMGWIMQSWMTAGKPDSCPGVSPGDPTPCQVGGRNAVRVPWSTTPGYMAQVWLNWKHQEQEAFSIRREPALTEERSWVLCELTIRTEGQVLPLKAVPLNLKEGLYTMIM